MPRKEANVENASTRKKNNLRVYEKAEDPSPYLFDINFKYESKELGKKESYCACWSNLKQKIGKCKLILFLFFLTAVVDTAVLAYVAMNRFKPHQQKTDRFNKEQEERNRTHKKELKKIEAEWKKLQNTDEVPESELLAAGRRRKKDLENQIEELNRRKRCIEKQFEKMSAEKDNIVKENSSNIVKMFKVGVIDKIKNKAREIFYGGADDKKESTDKPKEKNSICPAKEVIYEITEDTEEYDQREKIIDLQNSATKDIDDLKALRDKAQKFVEMRDALEEKVFKVEPSSMYTLGEPGETCGTGLFIETLKECRTALSELGLAGGGEYTEPETSYVYGCSVKEQSNNKLHFNTNKNGKPRIDESPICKSASSVKSIDPKDVESTLIQRLPELSKEYKRSKTKNAHGKNTDVVLLGMKTRIIFNKLSTTTEEQKKLEKELNDNFETYSNNVINDLNKDKDMNLRKLREFMTAYHDTLKVWKKKKDEAANKLKNFRKIEELTGQVKDIYRKVAEEYEHGQLHDDKYSYFESVLEETIKKNEDESSGDSKKKYATKLKNIKSKYEERKELDRIQQAYVKYKIKDRLENFSTIEGLKDDLKKIYKKLTGNEYTGTNEIFEDVLKETMKMLENSGRSPVEALNNDYERMNLKSIEKRYEEEEENFQKNESP